MGNAYQNRGNGGNGYGNRGNWQRPERPAPTNDRMFAPVQTRLTAKDVGNGVTVKLGAVYKNERAGKTEFVLYLQSAEGNLPLNQKGRILPVKLTWGLRLDIIGAIYGLSDKAAVEKANELTEIDWANDVSGKFVIFYSDDWTFEDKAASQEAGSPVYKTVPIIKARKLTATPPQNQVASQPDTTQASAAPSGDSYRATFDALAARYPELADAYRPAADAKPAQWTIATMKFKTAVMKIDSKLQHTISSLSASEPDLLPFFAPWSVEAITAEFGVGLADMADFPLDAIRATMRASAGK